jgi:hypothetical protein
MEEWGNARANAYYEAKLPRDYPKPRENDSVRVVEKFIREKYEQKRFIADSIPPPMNAPAEPEPVKEVRRPAAKPAVQVQQRSAPAPAPAPAAPPKEEPNLIDFFDSPAPPAPAAAPSAPAQQFDAFGQGGFNSQPNNFSTPSNSDPFFGGASNPPPQHHQPQQQPQQYQQQFQDPFFGGQQAPQSEFAPPAPPAPPKASADAILSLYSTAPSHQQHGGMQQNSHAQGISMMMGPGPQHGHPMGMPRGMPPQMGGFGGHQGQGFGGHQGQGFGGPQGFGGMGGYPQQQPHFQGGMMGGMPQQQYPPQQHHGMPGQYPPQQNGFGMPQQNGMYPPQQNGFGMPPQQRGW